MEEGYCPLASGSRGNSTLFRSKNTTLLIDAGLSGKATRERLAELNVSIEELDAILITHEHIDHIRGLNILAKRQGIPVIANADTARAICNALGEAPPLKIFSTGEPFAFQDLQVHPFSIQHDAIDPVAFTIHCEHQGRPIKTGLCTDLGFATTLVKMELKDCDYLILESNHQEEMVHATPRRPLATKQRILSRNGHLSNRQCAALLEEIHSPFLKHVHLAHLSDECNHPDRALQVVTDHLAERNLRVPLSIAHQHTLSHRISFAHSEAIQPQLLSEIPSV